MSRIHGKREEDRKELKDNRTREKPKTKWLRGRRREERKE